MESRICLFLAWFFFVFGPVVRSPLGSFGDLSLLTIAFYLAWSILVGRPLAKSLLPFCCIAFLLSGLAGGNTLLANNPVEPSALQPILRPVKGVIFFLGVYFAVRRLLSSFLERNGPRKTYEYLLSILYVVVVVHGLIIVLQFFCPDLRDLTYAFLKDMHVLDYNKQFRMPGLAGAGGAQVSAVQGLGFLIGVHLAIVKRKYLPFLMGNFLLIGSFILTGRTGFVLVAVAGLYYVLTVLRRLWRVDQLPGRFMNGRFALLAVALVVGLSFLAPVFSSMYAEDANSRTAIDRTFETVNNYRSTGQLTDRTLTALGKMFVLPEDSSIFIFGRAKFYNNTTGVYQSDLGYIRLLWGYGLIGLIGHVAFYLLMGFYIFRPCVREAMGMQNIMFGFVFLTSIFILNYKEVFFLTRMSYPLTVAAVMGMYWLSSCPAKGESRDNISS